MILKYICDLKAENFITWVFEEVFFATTSLTRINLVIEEFMLIFPKIQSVLHGIYMLMTHYLVSI